MKKLLLILALAANLASAQSHGPVPVMLAGHTHWGHPTFRGHHPVPGMSCLPSRPNGYWTTQSETVYVPGTWVAVVNACGQTQLTFVPAHYETINRQVWVARAW